MPRRRGTSVLLIAVDIVHLKTINDRYGYNVGDEVLRAVADVLVDSSRETDLVARYGRDEFAAFLVEAGAEHADMSGSTDTAKIPGRYSGPRLAPRIGIAYWICSERKTPRHRRHPPAGR